MKNKKRISKLLLISSTALSVPMICTVVAKSSPRIRIPKMISSGISRIGGLFRPSTSSTQTPRVVLTNNLRANVGSSSTSSLNQNTSSRGVTSSSTPSTSQGTTPQYNFDKYRQTNYYKQANLNNRRVLKPTSSSSSSSLSSSSSSSSGSSSIILENRKTQSGGLFQVREGLDGKKHRIEITSKGTRTETFDKDGNLVLISERGPNGLITEWIKDGKVVKQEIRDKTGVITNKFDSNGSLISSNKLSR